MIILKYFRIHFQVASAVEMVTKCR